MEQRQVEPSYDIECEVCCTKPTVVISGININLCGVCTWGDSKCLDPENW